MQPNQEIVDPIEALQQSHAAMKAQLESHDHELRARKTSAQWAKDKQASEEIAAKQAKADAAEKQKRVVADNAAAKRLQDELNYKEGIRKDAADFFTQGHMQWVLILLAVVVMYPWVYELLGAIVCNHDGTINLWSLRCDCPVVASRKARFSCSCRDGAVTAQ